ncbi:MAG: extracellular solute-binding protein family 1 [Paenibacillaceae bacterium]|jgi:putative aldouronate transport system substrate-binding protein|nr:extracellular solute-binding protein family 1 [Paenibacillaceae bacterium]
MTTGTRKYKWFAGTMVFTMAAGLMAGCSSDKPEVASSPSAAANTSATASPEANPFKNKLKFTMSVIDAEKAGLTASGQPAENFKWLSEKFNVEFEFVPLTWANYLDQTRVWLNSDSAPDLIMLDVHQSRYGEFVEWVKAGLFKPYPELAKYPNLKKQYDAMTAGKKFNIDGKMYAWPAVSDLSKYDYVYNGSGYFYRKDWAKDVGMVKEDDIYTYDEWNNLVKAVREKDPGKNGAGKTIGMIFRDAWAFPKYVVGGISPYMDTVVKDKNGTWIWGATLPETLEAVKEIKKQYDEGIIWKDQPLVKSGDADNNFVAGKSFSIVASGVTMSTTVGLFKNFKDANPALDPQTSIGLAKVKAPNGKLVAWQGSDHWSQTAMNHKMSDEKAERWAAIMDFYTSDEGRLFAGYGIKDVDWKLDSAGKVEVLWKEKDANGNPVYPYAYGSTSWLRPAGGRDAANLDNISNPQWARDMIRRNLELYSGPESNVIKMNVEQAYYTSPVFTKAMTDTDISKKIAELMTSKDIEKDWNNWVNQKLQEVQPGLDDLNKNLK